MGNLYNTIAVEEKEILSYPQFHHRLPFYAQVPPDGRALYDQWVKEGRNWEARSPEDAAARFCAGTVVLESSQSVIDQEIAYAVEAGLDYWAFWWTSNDGSAHQQSLLNLYLSSAKKKGLRWCPILCAHGAAQDENWLVDRMCEPDFFTVLDGRPVIYTPVDFMTPDNIDKIINSIRNKCAARGLKPYIVAISFHCGGQKLADLARGIDADAVSWYSSQMFDMANPYSYLMERDTKKWDVAAATGMQVIPGFATGWDCRPRNRRDIMREYMFLGGYETGYITPDATSVEIEEMLTRAMTWNAKRGNPDTNPNTVLVYAWNEFSEAGVTICPQYNPENPQSPNRACLDAVKNAINKAPVLAQTSAQMEAMLPTIHLFTEAIGPVSGPFMLTVRFNEDVIGLGLEDFDIKGGSLSALSGTGAEYNLCVTPINLEDDTDIKINLRAGAVKTKAGITNEASHPFVIKCERPKYPVTFDTNGGVVKMDAYVISHGDTIISPPSPKKVRHEFMGWYTNEAQKWDFAVDVVLRTTTLYAKWEAVPETPYFELGWKTHFTE